MSVEVVPYAGRKREVQPDKREYRSFIVPHHGAATIEVVSYSGSAKETESGGRGRTSSTDLGELLFRIHPARRLQQAAERQKAEKVLRRISGFLVEDEGEEYKVVFIEDGQPVQYYMPSTPLRKAGITAPNQPFQMDEIEVEISGGRIMTGYNFTPLAKPSDAFNDAIELNEERDRKLKTIFRKFGKTAD